MNYKLEDLTIIIPSINRRTLNYTLDSVKYLECNIIISFDNKVPIFDTKSLSSSRVKCIFNVTGKSGPGYTKQFGIRNLPSNTKLFSILDDDDSLNANCLRNSIELFNKYPDISWVQCNGNFEKDTLIDPEYFFKNIFRYEIYNSESLKKSIFTGSPGVIYKKVDFDSNKLHYDYEVMDDIIPNVKLFSKTKGIVHNEELVNTFTTPGSVSRKIMGFNDIMKVVNDIVLELLEAKSLNEFNVWDISIRNFLLRRLHNKLGEPLK